MTEWTALTGRRSAPSRPTAARTRPRSSSRWAPSPTPRSRSSTISARQGRPVGCVAVTSFRPFPAAELACRAPASAGGRRRGADRRAAGGRQAADPGGPLGSVRRGRRGRDGSARPLLLGRTRVARRRGRRPRRRLRPARAPRRRSGPPRRPRHPPSARARARADVDLRPRGRLVAARPLDRRVRVGDDQQAAWRRSPASCSTRSSRPTRATARRRRACRRPTT